MNDPWDLLGIAVAALGGAAVGVERQHSGHASGPHARFGGVRTLTILGGLCGFAGWLAKANYTGFAVVLAAGAVALVVTGYVIAGRREVDATTEAAALVVIAAGIIAGLGWLRLASGAIALTTLLLAEKSRLHGLVARIDDDELRAAARFGVMAVVILPLLPEGPFGPWGGIRPRALWLLVLLFTGMSFAGYLAQRMVGAGRGYPVAGMLAGLVSSTNATLTFSRLSRRGTAISRPLAAGVVAACTVLFPRVFIAASVLEWSVARTLVFYLAPPFLIGLTSAVWMWRQADDHEAAATTPLPNPLQIVPALQMALIFQVVLFGVAAMRDVFGSGGLIASGAVLGLTDVDALTISMTSAVRGGTSPDIAARAIAVGILSNSILKAVVAVAIGGATYKKIAGGLLAAMAAALGAAIVARL